MWHCDHGEKPEETVLTEQRVRQQQEKVSDRERELTFKGVLEKPGKFTDVIEIGLDLVHKVSANNTLVVTGSRGLCRQSVILRSLNFTPWDAAK